MGGGHFQEFEDEYMETLYAFHEESPNTRVRNGILAKAMGVSPASATEMVQRLSSKGYVDYQAYKGVLLTKSGLIFGKQMKRRHRLAEVLLEKLPFVGNVHETACRLEHAFDDDLEVCISIFLGNPEIDPSGKEIPPPISMIAERISLYSPLLNLSELAYNNSGQVEFIYLDINSEDSLKKLGIEVGTVITREVSGYFANEKSLSLSESIMNSILVRSVKHVG